MTRILRTEQDVRIDVEVGNLDCPTDQIMHKAYLSLRRITQTAWHDAMNPPY